MNYFINWLIKQCNTSLTQGPPGTGKTATAIRILSAWVQRAGHGDAVLATSDSHIAVDNLLEGCLKAGLRAVRLGKPEAISDHLRQHCVDFLAPPNSTKQEVHDLKTQAIRNAQVVCATSIGIGSELLERHQFGSVLMDEATQASEPSTMVALCRGAQQLVLERLICVLSRAEGV